MGRLELLQIKSCTLSAAGDELVVASEGKCHLIKAVDAGAPALAQWHGAIGAALQKRRGDAAVQGAAAAKAAPPAAQAAQAPKAEPPKAEPSKAAAAPKLVAPPEEPTAYSSGT